MPCDNITSTHEKATDDKGRRIFRVGCFGKGTDDRRWVYEDGSPAPAPRLSNYIKPGGTISLAMAQAAAQASASQPQSTTPTVSVPTTTLEPKVASAPKLLTGLAAVGAALWLIAKR